ncbi:MAG: hypothetical protein Q8P41_11765 [Pseudomonadota bacterium]|nr:hypothetical protein [Pseudomonadota bacterium]
MLPSGALRLLEELGPPVLSTLDLASAQKDDWFAVPSGGWAYDLDTDADGAVTLAYTAPPTDGGAGYDRSRIVHVSADGTETAVACRDAAGAWCFYPAVTPDSARVWFVIAGEDVPSGAEHAVAYVDAPGGAIREIAPWGTEPAVSPDGAHLAWVAVDPDTRRRSLVLADVDGAPERTLVASSVVTDITSPFFSTDGAWVYFVVPTPAVASAWHLLVPAAQAHGAHDVPGDWWRVSTAGGAPEQVTDLQTILYDGRAHPDGQWFAAATREGVVLVDIGSGAATSVLELRTVRSLAWVR